MDTAFFTGFPGFLGARLIPRVLARDPELHVVCLVQPKFAAQAKQRVADLVDADPALDGRIELVEGDLTAPDLGLLDRDRLTTETTEVWHLAAVYDLSVPRELGMRVNVEGTRHLLRFAEECRRLERHHYISTCYVSGRWCGPFRETDLDRGQTFNNFYEETKFLAEVDVAGSRDGGMPTTVYRPAIVVGDSRTGETQKFDGPYFLLQWLLRQRGVAVVPVIGDPTMVRLNVVPSDFVLDAITALSGMPQSSGVTYQLADPEPLTVDALLAEMCRAVGVRGVRVPLPHRLTTWLLDHVEPLQRYVGIPASAVEYFAHPTHYDTANATRDLEGTGVTCPRVPDYLPTLVGYLREHRGDDVGVMV